MEPLVTIKRVLVLLWMCPDDKTSGTQNEISYSIFTPLIFLTNFSIVVAHSMYVLKFISIDLEGSLNATMMSIMVSGVAFILPLTIILRQNVDSILKQLSNIYDSSECFDILFSICRLYEIYLFCSKKYRIDSIFGPCQ